MSVYILFVVAKPWIKASRVCDSSIDRRSGMGFDCTLRTQINHFHMRKEVNSSVWFVLFCNVDASWCLMLDHCWCYCCCCTFELSHMRVMSRCYLPIQSRDVCLQCFVSSCKHVLHSQLSAFVRVYDVCGNRTKRQPIFGMACFGICSIIRIQLGLEMAVFVLFF